MRRRKKKKFKFKRFIFILIILFALLFSIFQLMRYLLSEDKPSEKAEEPKVQIATVVEDKDANIWKAESGEEQDDTKTQAYSVLVTKSKYTLYLLDNGKVVKEFGCALGKNPGQKEKEGDLKTPTGTFLVDEILDASEWTHDFGDGKGEIPGAYGPWFISLDTNEMSKGQWGGIGIHGTHDPESIGTMATEGCIRLRNADLRELKKYVKVGTKVVIEE